MLDKGTINEKLKQLMFFFFFFFFFLFSFRFMFDRVYAEEIESRLHSHGLLTSIILLREDYTLTEAIENAARLQCLYGIIAMPMHEERRTASFHILFGQTEGG